MQGSRIVSGRRAEEGQIVSNYVPWRCLCNKDKFEVTCKIR